ncbi:hypothetical protein CRM22_009817 [Opisthorchis felineus]|uniref:Serine/threonine-protein phosphatase n=1 Tax=Opisthorchis felineus TaxID=147828 RepID=A0A4S2LBC6_OPIFE|nr:hypothetical protein CRM22_009817 [Opisthorchis felineus]
MKKTESKMTIEPQISKARRNLILNRSKALVQRLTEFQVLKGKPVQIAEMELIDICAMLKELLLKEPSCLSLTLDPSLNIIGDVHGHYTQLLQVLNAIGHPPNTQYLFLGNFVNRGEKSIETLALLFAYKLLYPRQIYLLRGNHECDQLGKMYGCYAECHRRFSSRLWRVLMDTFNYLPVAALIDNGFFCSHSGISPTLIYSGHTGPKALQEYISRWIPRPTEIENNLLATHLIWSEPDAAVEKWERNPAGLGYLYGPSAVTDFCSQFQLFHVIRSNGLLTRGYEFFPSNHLISIFSAPDFMGIYRNCGSMLTLTHLEDSPTVVCRIKSLRPIFLTRGGKATGRKVLSIEDIKPNSPWSTRVFTVADSHKPCQVK